MNITTIERVDDLPTAGTDDQGRIWTEYTNKRVTVAIVEVENDYPDEDDMAAAYRNASETAESLAEEWDDTSSEAWSELTKKWYQEATRVFSIIIEFVGVWTTLTVSVSPTASEHAPLAIRNSAVSPAVH
nr:hypothetical protein [Haloferax profundi]